MGWTGFLTALVIFGPMVCAPMVYALGRARESARDTMVIGITAGCLVCSGILTACNIRAVSAEELSILSGGLRIPWVLTGGLSFTLDGFRTVYSLIASLMWLFTTLFAQEYFRHEREGLNVYWLFTLLTLGATQGVMLSADFMTTFVFFEILSLTSFTWVMHEQTPEAIRAGYVYLFIAVFGGLVLLMGLLLLYSECGTLSYAALREMTSGYLMDSALTDGARGLTDGVRILADHPRILAAGSCILFGFGAKAGMYPLHVWLPMAHPVAPSPASALLSGILTKVGVFGILMAALDLLPDSPAFGLLILTLALITMLLGAVLALCSVNLKRTLACSSMSQIGFILTGIGSMILCNAAGESSGAALAYTGTVLHMVNHSLLKLALFMTAGVAMMNAHVLTLDDLRGWGRNQPVLKFVFGVSALGISGVPLLNGYISKSMLHEGLVHLMESSGTADIWPGVSLPGYLHAAEWIFLFSGGLTFAYMMKLYLCLFHERNTNAKRQAVFDRAPRYMNTLSAVVLILSACLLIPLGQPMFVLRLAALMGGVDGFTAFAWENLKGALISLSIGGVVYAGFVRPVLRPGGRYVNIWPPSLDIERNIYHPLATDILPSMFGLPARMLAENVIGKPLCGMIVFAGSVLGRALADSTDALVILLRRGIMREERVRNGKPRISRWTAYERATAETLHPLLENFSFTLLMACLGIIVIFVLLFVLF